MAATTIVRVIVFLATAIPSPNMPFEPCVEVAAAVGLNLLGRGSSRDSRNALTANYETSVAGDLSPFELRVSPIHVGYWRVERNCYKWDRSVAVDPNGGLRRQISEGRDQPSNLTRPTRSKLFS